MTPFKAGKLYAFAITGFWEEIQARELRVLLGDDQASLPESDEEAELILRRIMEAVDRYA